MKVSLGFMLYWMFLVLVTVIASETGEHLYAISIALIQLAAAVLYAGSKISEAIEDKK